MKTTIDGTTTNKLTSKSRQKIDYTDKQHCACEAMSHIHDEINAQLCSCTNCYICYVRTYKHSILASHSGSFTSRILTLSALALQNGSKGIQGARAYGCQRHSATTYTAGSRGH